MVGDAPIGKMALNGCNIHGAETLTWKATAQRVWGARARLRVREGAVLSLRYTVLEVT